jgi:aminomethyltransferase
MTAQSAFHPRTSKLTSTYHVVRHLWMPAQYDATGSIAEYWACKNAATLQDMSGLKKFDIVGPDAQELLQVCMTRNVGKLSVHRGLYALICDQRGTVLDDGTLFRLEETAFRWCCGSDNSALHLREQAEAHGLNVRILSHGSKLQNLALQGPKSRDILRKIVFTQPSRPALDNLKWFGFTIARLHDRNGPMFMLCRTGFTGELGYEIFCDSADAVLIWDALMDSGAPMGLVPMGGDALEMLRIEAGLMTSGAEFGPDADAFESGLGFAVDMQKPDFVGRTALARNTAAPRRDLVGLHMVGNEAPTHGDAIFVGREQVGTITSACTSPTLGHAIAMARIAVENAAPGTELEVGKLDGHMKRLGATVVALPFLDPKREKARA